MFCISLCDPRTKSLETPALDHNFWTQNLSKSSKVSKDLDCSPVSNKNFREILPSNGLGPGPGEVGQGGLKALHLWRHSQKICNPQPKNLFRVQTRRLGTSFEPLNSSLPLSAPELCACKPCAIRLYWRENPQNWPDAKVLMWKMTWLVHYVLSLEHLFSNNKQANPSHWL